MTRVKTWLVVSLVLNVFLLGALGGGAYTWVAKQRAATVAQQRGLRFAASELTEARRQQLRDALRQTRRDAMPLIVAARQGRIDIAQAFAAPQFDQAALDDALSRTRIADSTLRGKLEDTIAQYAATLTPEERVKLVDALERHGPLHVGPAPKQ
jgi:uncharacterized membrane protein